MLQKEWENNGTSRRLWWFCGLTVVLCCAVYAGILATRGMTPTEGWYSYYAWLMNEEGAVPYLDFELLFPPLYTYLIALFCRVFGYSVLALRIFGVLVFALTGWLAYLIFEKLSGKPVFAMLAGLLTASVLQSEVVQVFYDYIRLMDLCAYGAIYCFLCTVTRIERHGTLRLWEPSLWLGAVLATFAGMLKQSSGLVLLIYCVIFFLFAVLVFPKRNLYGKAFVVTVTAAVLLYGIMALFLLSQGSLSAYVYYNFQAAVDAKGGSLLTVLFGWIRRAKGYWWLGILGAVGAAALMGLWCLFRHLSHRYPQLPEKRSLPLRIWLPLTGLIFLVVFSVASLFWEEGEVLWLGAQKKFTAFLVSMVSFAAVSILAIVRKIQKKEMPHGSASFCFFSGAVFVLAYAVCTSGGLTESQVALGYGLFALLFLPTLRFRKSEWVALALAVAMLVNIGFGFERKMRTIYNWWGLQIGSVTEQTVETDVPLLKGLKMEPKYVEMYEGVRNTVWQYTREGEEIFVFPHMPILYLTCERPRATKTAVQWFDVSTDAAVVGDMAILEEKVPKVMVICRIDDTVMTYHENAFRGEEHSGLYRMQEFLPGFLAENGYVAEGTYPISETYTVEVWVIPQGE